jgi:hypothetical protein
MSYPRLITIEVEVESYIKDCGPIGDFWTNELVEEVAAEVFSRFDFCDICDQFDELILLSLRERNLIPSSTLEIS